MGVSIQSMLSWAESVSKPGLPEILIMQDLYEKKRVGRINCGIAKVGFVTAHGERFFNIRDIISSGLAAKTLAEPVYRTETGRKEFVLICRGRSLEQSTIAATLLGLSLFIDELRRKKQTGAVGTSIERAKQVYKVLLNEINTGKLSVGNSIYDTTAKKAGSGELAWKSAETLPPMREKTAIGPVKLVAAIEAKQEEAMKPTMSDDEAAELGRVISGQVFNYVRSTCILREQGVPNAVAHLDGLYGLLDKLRVGMFPDAPARVA